jgi:hypothetical protein
MLPADEQATAKIRKVDKFTSGQIEKIHKSKMEGGMKNEFDLKRFLCRGSRKGRLFLLINSFSFDFTVALSRRSGTSCDFYVVLCDFSVTSLWFSVSLSL